jgi:predicted DNA-binding transcriptional regulator YafY
MEIVQFLYTNHKGITRRRMVQPLRLEFTSTAWYPEPQWILFAADVESGEVRGFAMERISQWQRLTLIEDKA